MEITTQSINATTILGIVAILHGGTGISTIGAANTVMMTTDGVNISYAQVANAQVAAGAAIAYSKLNLSASIVNADVAAGAAIAYSKLNLTGSIVNADVNAAAAIAYSKLNLALSIVNGDIAVGAAIAYSKLALTGSIVNADVNAAAAIAYSKLNLSASIVNADIAAGAAIAYSKLNLSASIVNADVAAGAAIAYSKLNLALSIVDADVNAAAAIAGTKISPDFGSQNITTTGVLILSSQPASTGSVRFGPAALAASFAMCRNAANTFDLKIITADASNNIFFGDPTSHGAQTFVECNTSVVLRTLGTAQLTVTNATATFVGAIVLAGANPATTANIRSPNNTAIISARNAANSNNVQALIVDGSDFVILGGDVGSSGWSLRAGGNTFLSSSSASVLVQAQPTWQVGQTLTPTWTHVTRSGDNAAIDSTWSAQTASTTSTGTNRNGANIIFRGGARKAADTNGTQGGVRLCLGASSTAVLVEACEVVANGNAVVSLCRNAALTATEMPANTGNLVIFIGNAGTDPTASAVSGGILFASAGALKWRGSGGTVTTLGPA